MVMQEGTVIYQLEAKIQDDNGELGTWIIVPFGLKVTLEETMSEGQVQIDNFTGRYIAVDTIRILHAKIVEVEYSVFTWDPDSRN